tara:strand:+ start:2080 stop:2274 length:195 start_codon:yes stop_codon:yes gene_type:complete
MAKMSGDSDIKGYFASGSYLITTTEKCTMSDVLSQRFTPGILVNKKANDHHNVKIWLLGERNSF